MTDEAVGTTAGPDTLDTQKCCLPCESTYRDAVELSRQVGGNFKLIKNTGNRRTAG
jgi:hypothetical protein